MIQSLPRSATQARRPAAAGPTRPRPRLPRVAAVSGREPGARAAAPGAGPGCTTWVPGGRGLRRPLRRVTTGLAAAGTPRSSPAGNCIKIGPPGKLILGDYFQENGTSRRPFLLLRISFPGRPILYNSSWRQLYKNRSSRKINSRRTFSREGGFHLGRPQKFWIF